MTQEDYWTALPAPAAPPLDTVPSLASLTPQPEHRSFYRRPLFLILASLVVLAVAAVLYGFPTGSAAKAVNTVSGGALTKARSNAAWNEMTPDDQSKACAVTALVGGPENLVPTDGTPLTADQKALLTQLLKDHCK